MEGVGARLASSARSSRDAASGSHREEGGPSSVAASRPGTTQPFMESVCLSGSLSRFFGVFRRTGVGAFGGARRGLLRAMGAGDGAFGGAGLGLTAGAGAA